MRAIAFAVLVTMGATVVQANEPQPPITLLLVSDSTVASYPNPPADRPDLTGWGQVLGEFFNDRVTIKNRAISGRSSKSFIKEGHWKKALAERPDYILIQFGHNDTASDQRATDPESNYRDYLRKYLRDTRTIGAQPILVTPMTRRVFRKGKIYSTLEPYADATRQVGEAENTPVVRLHQSSIRLFNQLGDAGSADFSPSVTDRTHFSGKGARAMAQLVVYDLAALVPELRAYLKKPRTSADILVPEPPPSPAPGEWDFVEALSAPLTWNPHWVRDKKAVNEADLLSGVSVEATFPDPEGVLETAYQDLQSFFESVEVPTNGAYRIVTEKRPMPKFEAFKLVVSENQCRIQAGDTEGIRRGIFFLQDELLRAEGPFLVFGEQERTPFIRTRISRCFFGPIKRPPKNKDELIDDVDYYPDEYLNRLAHEGVNALWLTIEFKDICKTSLTSVVDPKREQRLAKLRKTVAKCRRYGIEVFVFCIEPRVMSSDNPLLKEHPELGRAAVGSSFLFCPFSTAAQTYLYEAVNDIFANVPRLGGLIDISFGERYTTCLSGADKNWKVSCPICIEKHPGDILNASLSAMKKGMHAANPKAKLISWLYVPQNGTGVQRSMDMLKEIAQRTPSGVICQCNFESAGTKIQLGKTRHAGDYWLSYLGPSELFEEVAAGVAAGEAEVAAKLQACNSFEVSTVPYVPVPRNLYHKYREMRRLGVTTVMQCWYIGNMPSVMNRAAASELPFATAELTEDEFLFDLARRDWGPAHAQQVVDAWRLFSKAYDNYPLSNAFQYYGPMHDGVVWPLHLKPAHKNLSPIWKLEYPPSGDRIGECFSGTHTLVEGQELCKRLSDTWQQGLEILREIKPQFAEDPNRLLDITVAEALGIQFRSGYNILRFYDLRERLLYGSSTPPVDLLNQLQSIIKEEIEIPRRWPLSASRTRSLGSKPRQKVTPTSLPNCAGASIGCGSCSRPN